MEHYFIAEPLNTGRSIGQNIGWFNGETSFVDAHSTASSNQHKSLIHFIQFGCAFNLPLARILNYITHATLQSLCLTIRNTFAHPTLTSFLTYRPIRHGRRFRAFSMSSRASRFLLTRCILCVTTLNTRRHVLAILTAWWILIAANRSLIATQFAVLIATRVVIFGSQETSVALFVAFDAQITAEGFLGLGKASTGFGLKHFANGAQGAGGEFLTGGKTFWFFINLLPF